MFLKSLKSKSKKEEINSFDISDKKKCLVIKIKNKRTNYYFEDVGGAFFSYVKKLNKEKVIRRDRKVFFILISL